MTNLVTEHDPKHITEDGAVMLVKLPELVEAIKDAEYLAAIAPYFLTPEYAYSVEYATWSNEKDTTVLDSWIATLTEAFGTEVRIMVRDTLKVWDARPGQNVRSRRELVREERTIIELRFWIL